VNHNGISPEVTVKGFKVLYVQCIGWDWWWYDFEWQWRRSES